MPPRMPMVFSIAILLSIGGVGGGGGRDAGVFEPFLMASPAPMNVPRMLDTVPMRPRTRKTLPLNRLVRSEAMLEDRFTSLTLPPAVRTSSLPRLQKMRSRNVPCRAVEPVVRADDERGQIHDRHLLFGLDIAALLRQLPLAQHDEGHDRQHDRAADTADTPRRSSAATSCRSTSR